MMNLIQGTVFATVWALSTAPQDAAPPDPPTSFSDRLNAAEEAGFQGSHAMSARLYGGLYRSLSSDQKIGTRGKFMIFNAIDEARLALNQNHNDPQLLKEMHTLVEESIEDRNKAINAGETTTLPSRLLEDRAWLKERVDEQRLPARPSPEQFDETEGPEPELGSATIVEPIAVAKKEQPPITTAPDIPPTTRRKRRIAPTTLDWMAIGAGIASITGGVSLIGLGYYNNQKLDENNADFHSSNMDNRDRELYNRFDDKKRPLMTSQIVIGPILTVAGIALTTWGARSLQRHRHPKRYATTLAPRVSPREASLNLSLTF